MIGLPNWMNEVVTWLNENEKRFLPKNITGARGTEGLKQIISKNNIKAEGYAQLRANLLETALANRIQIDEKEQEKNRLDNAQEAAREEESMNQSQSVSASSWVPGSSLNQESSPMSGQLKLNKVGGKSLSTFWANYKDNWEREPSKVNKLGAVSLGTTSGKTPFMTALNNKVLNPPVKTNLAKLFNEQRGNGQSLAWQVVPGAKFENGQWTSKFYKRLPTAEQQRNAEEKRKEVLKTVSGPVNAMQSYGLPLFDLLNGTLVKNGFDTIGPINEKGLPIYLGRYFDPITKRIRTIPKPKMAINPYDWDQVYFNIISRLAYSWNTFARGAERLTSHIKKKPVWTDLVNQKKKEGSVENRRYKQMIATMKKIMAEEYEPYTQATKQEKEAMLLSIRNWDWRGLGNLIETVSKRYINSNLAKLSPGQLLKWRSYEKWTENASLAAAKNELLSEITAPQTMSKIALTEQVKKRPTYINNANSNSIKSYAEKIVRKGVKRPPKMTVAEIIRQAELVKNRDRDEVIDVTLRKKVKTAEKPLSLDAFFKEKNQYDETTEDVGVPESSLMQPSLFAV